MIDRSLPLLLTAAALAPAALAPAAPRQDEPPVPSPPPRPRYTTLREDEDWSVLRSYDPATRDDPWDRLKYIPLADEGRTWLSLGGHTRFRLESWSNFRWGQPANDDETFLLWRAALHADLHVGENLRGFVEGKSAQSTNRSLPGGHRRLDVDSLALEQAFVDLRIPLGTETTLTVRPGRQGLLFGKERLVSPLPWSNTLRRWDGVSVIARHRDWTIQGFWTQFAPVQKFGFNDPESSIQFFGVYATGPVPGTRIGLDLYYLGLDRDVATFNGTTGGEDRHTFGGRIFGPVPGTTIDYDLEGAYQSGEVGSGDVSAFMIGSQLGISKPNWWAAPRFFLGFDYATGDETPGGDVHTFNQLFPLGHAFYGLIDAVGRQNAVDVNFGVKAKPAPTLALAATAHYLRVETTGDNLYNAGGVVIRPTAPGAGHDLGWELDLVGTWHLDRHLAAQLGYAHFFAGDFIDDTGPSNDIDFVYVQMQYTF